jgi:hypothetical protein
LLQLLGSPIGTDLPNCEMQHFWPGLGGNRRPANVLATAVLDPFRTE